MGRAWAVISRYGVDLLIVLGAVLSAAGTVLRDDAARPGGGVLWLEAGAVAAVVLVLLARRRLPFAAPVATWVGSSALSFLDGELIVGQGALYVTGMGAALLLGNLRRDARARLGLVVVLVGAAIVISNSATSTAGDLIVTPAGFAVGWLIGYVLRQRTSEAEAAEERAARAERERESAARVAVAEERGRIARELHDVVAHAVSVMVLQVGAVRHRMPVADTEDREALGNVEHAGRTALAEMRRLLSAMRSDGDRPDLLPQPGLAELDALADDVRAAGLDVHLQVRGERLPLPPALDLSAYRIVQEGLTNALKHAGASCARVTVTYEPSALHLEVRDDGRSGSTSSRAGPGHGLVGIRERVKIYGGEMTAGPAEDGGFLLRASLPVDGAAS